MVENTVEVRLTSADSQPQRADVVILGGGAIGVGITHPAPARASKTLWSSNAASSAAAPRQNLWAESRQTFLTQRTSCWVNVRWRPSAISNTRLRIDIGLRSVGYLFLARTEEEAVGLRSATEIQNGMGIASRDISPAQCAQLNPYLDASALVFQVRSSRRMGMLVLLVWLKDSSKPPNSSA